MNQPNGAARVGRCSPPTRLITASPPMMTGLVQRDSLDTFWFVNSSPGLDAYTFARSPVSMQVRGVIIDPADLAAV